jgi:ubiquinone/menaquinone biosynthesis C-methylase UbiE
MPETPAPRQDSFSRLVADLSQLSWTGRIGRIAALGISFLLRIAYHLLYHQLAFTYDLAAWIVSAGQWADWRRCVLPYLPAGPVLEIAHGTGTLSLDMTDRGYAVTAIDLSPEMGSIAAWKKRKWSKRSQGAGPALIRADVCRLPFRAGHFSSAVATFPADFLFQSEAAREVHRALRPGGRWIIIPTAYPEWIAKRLLRDEQSAFSKPVWHAILDPVEDCGFTVRMEIVRRPKSRVLIILAEKEALHPMAVIKP